MPHALYVEEQQLAGASNALRRVAPQASRQAVPAALPSTSATAALDDVLLINHHNYYRRLPLPSVQPPGLVRLVRFVIALAQAVDQPIRDDAATAGTDGARRQARPCLRSPVPLAALPPGVALLAHQQPLPRCDHGQVVADPLGIFVATGLPSGHGAGPPSPTTAAAAASATTKDKCYFHNDKPAPTGLHHDP